MSHLFLDTFFEFGVVEDFVYRAEITVILIIQIYSAVWVCDSEQAMGRWVMGQCMLTRDRPLFHQPSKSQ